MTRIANATPCPDDRLALAGRNAVSGPDWEALKAHLRGCADCRASWLAARAFDGEGGAEGGDEGLVRAAVERALSAPARRRRRRSLRPASLAVAASVVLVAAVASAGIVVGVLARRAPPAPVPAPAQAADDRPAHHRHGPREALRPQPSPDPVPLPPDPAPPPPAAPPPEAPPALDTAGPAVPRSPATRPSAPARSIRRAAIAAPPPDVPPALEPAAPAATTAPPVAPARPSPSPQAALFARATAARRAGKDGEAIALFQQLRDERSGTQEAIVGSVSLGELLAARGDARAALSSFEAYLRDAPAGPLVPEALASRARMLARLGRADEARQVWDELSRRFPHSPYSLRGGPDTRREP